MNLKALFFIFSVRGTGIFLWSGLDWRGGGRIIFFY